MNRESRAGRIDLLALGCVGVLAITTIAGLRINASQGCESRSWTDCNGMTQTSPSLPCSTGFKCCFYYTDSCRTGYFQGCIPTNQLCPGAGG